MKRKLSALFLAGIVLLAGCSQGQSGAALSEKKETAVENGTQNQTDLTEAEPKQETTVSAKVDGTNREISVGGNSRIADKYSERDLDASWNKKEATKILLNGEDAEVSGSGADISGRILTITKAGSYVISGIWNDGQIIVAAADTDKVQIVLNNAEISSNSGAVLNVQTADKFFLTLAEGSHNKMTDAKNYTDTGTDMADAAIYSKSDITINGSGQLMINAQYKDGIKSKDELTIIGGKLVVIAQEDGLTGKDSLAIKDGEFIITAGKDGLKASNTSDADRGWISVDGGDFTINAQGDAIQAETMIEINDGSFNITSGGGASVSTKTGQQMQKDQFMPRDFHDGQNQLNTPKQMQPKMDKNRNMPSENGQRAEAIPPMNMGQNPANHTQMQQGTTNAVNQNVESAKGIKAGVQLIIYNGSFAIDSADDSLHSDGNMMINGGILTLTTGDDALHAEVDMEINEPAKISVISSIEGIEGRTVTINGGKIEIIAYDDGINATDGSPVGERAQTGVAITITGGDIVIQSGGDGLDSNGDIIVTGGQTIISASNGAGEGALDYNGRVQIKEGTVVVK